GNQRKSNETPGESTVVPPNPRKCTRVHGKSKGYPRKFTENSKEQIQPSVTRERGSSHRPLGHAARQQATVPPMQAETTATDDASNDGGRCNCRRQSTATDARNEDDASDNGGAARSKEETGGV